MKKGTYLVLLSVGLMFLSVSSSYSSDSEIMLYDGTSVTQLTDNRHRDSSPQINDNGDVVWYGYDGSDGGDLPLRRNEHDPDYG